MFEKVNSWVALACAIYALVVLTPVILLFARHYVGEQRLKKQTDARTTLARKYPHPILTPEARKEMYREVRQDMERQGYREVHRGLFSRPAH